ncbi:MAG: ABC transporter ATP-binding protein [Halovenus sp.]
MTEHTTHQTEPSTVGRTLLVADEISRQFGEVTVIDGLSLALEAGQLHALVGPNGSGKTTLLQLLAGVDAPTAGSVSYEGPDTARTIGYLPQRPSFRPGFTARETLEFYTALVDTDPTGLLDRVGLADAADRRVEELSGGMVRLLGLAQATVGDPPVILLDEPGSGLDPGMRRRMAELGRELAADGAAVLYSSHDLELVEAYSDRVFVVEGGSIVDRGAPDSLCATYGVETLWDVFEVAVDRSGGELDVIGVSES